LTSISLAKQAGMAIVLSALTDQSNPVPFGSGIQPFTKGEEMSNHVVNIFFVPLELLMLALP
jgi:hypothetical protein